MKQSSGKGRQTWFWVGVTLLALSALWWLTSIFAMIDEPQAVGDIAIFAVICTVIPIGIGIYGVLRGKKVFATISSAQKGWRELSQSRAAVWAVVGIIFFNAIVVIVDAVIYREMPRAQVFGTNVSMVGAFAVDLFLAINLLRGKHWARTWMLIRLILGLLAWGVIDIIQADFGSLILQIGYCGALLLLITGTSTTKRMAGSIALYIVLYSTGHLVALMVPFAG